MSLSIEKSHSLAYEFAARDRRSSRKCRVCGKVIPPYDKKYITFASLEGDSQNIFCCGNPACMEAACNLYERDSEFRIPLPCSVIDRISQAKAREGVIVLIGIAAVSLAMIFVAARLFLAGAITTGIGLVLTHILITAMGVPWLREAMPALSAKSSIGYVFLSWTVRHPRDHDTMHVVADALKRQNITFFDYTSSKLDDSTDRSDEIHAALSYAIENADYSIEVNSIDILMHDWVQRERQLLREHDTERIFLCIDADYMYTKSKKEEFIMRLDCSEGLVRPSRPPVQLSRWLGWSDSADQQYRDVCIFESKRFKIICAILAAAIRFEIATGWRIIKYLRHYTRLLKCLI